MSKFIATTTEPPSKQKGSMDPSTNQNTGQYEQIPVRLGSLPEITIHRVTGDELASLARGAPDAWQLSVALCLFSLALGFVTPLATANLPYRFFVLFVSLAALCSGFGFPLLCLWLKSRKASIKTLRNIRGRLAP